MTEYEKGPEGPEYRPEDHYRSTGIRKLIRDIVELYGTEPMSRENRPTARSDLKAMLHRFTQPWRRP